jgi:hypothetical protein
LIGGGIAIKAAFIASRKQFEYLARKADIDDISRSLRFLKSIKDELESIWEGFGRQVRPALDQLPQNQPFMLYFPVAHNYFIVFDKNVGALGEVRNDDLRKKIVFGYVRAKGFVDSIHYNNHLFQQIQEAQKNMFGSNAGVQLQNIANLTAQMTAYAVYLKAASEELKTIYAELIQALQQDVEKLEIEKNTLIERMLLH